MPEKLLALGMAYMNELDHERAIETLKGWVANHLLYAGMLDDTLAKGFGGEEEEDMYGSDGIEGEDEDNMADVTHHRMSMRVQTMAKMHNMEKNVAPLGFGLGTISFGLRCG